MDAGLLFKLSVISIIVGLLKNIAASLSSVCKISATSLSIINANLIGGVSIFSPFFYYTLVYTKSSSLFAGNLFCAVVVFIIPTEESPAIDFCGFKLVASNVTVDPS